MLVHDLEMIVVVPLDYRVLHVLVLRTETHYYYYYLFEKKSIVVAFNF